MANFFYWLYLKTRQQQTLFYISIILLTTLAAFVASQVRLEENITSLIPQDKTVVQVSEALQGLEINKRLVFHLYAEDSLPAKPEDLIEVYNTLSDTLESHYSEYIDKVTGEIPDDKIEKLHQYYLNNLPFYLQKADYEVLADRIQGDNIRTSLNKFYRALLSPVGIGAKKIMVKDPLGLAAIPLERTKSLQLNDNFSLYKNHILSKDRKHLIFLLC